MEEQPKKTEMEFVEDIIARINKNNVSRDTYLPVAKRIVKDRNIKDQEALKKLEEFVKRIS